MLYIVDNLEMENDIYIAYDTLLIKEVIKHRILINHT